MTTTLDFPIVAKSLYNGVVYEFTYTHLGTVIANGTSYEPIGLTSSSLNRVDDPSSWEILNPLQIAALKVTS